VEYRASPMARKYRMWRRSMAIWQPATTSDLGRGKNFADESLG
jgi:hypothetical protein